MGWNIQELDGLEYTGTWWAGIYRILAGWNIQDLGGLENTEYRSLLLKVEEKIKR